MSETVLRSGVNIGIKLGAQNVPVQLGDQNVDVRINSIQVGSSSYSAEAQAVFAKMPNALTTTEKDNIATVIDAMVLSGNYNQIDYFYGFFLQDPDNALTSWFGTKTAIAVNSPTHAPSTGYLTDGITQFVNYDINPYTDCVNATLNDSYQCSYIYENYSLDASVRYLFGVYDSISGYFQTLRQTNGLYFSINGPEGSVYSEDGNHLLGKTRYAVMRLNNTEHKLEKNGVVVRTQAVLSTGIPDNTIYGMVRHSGVGPSGYLAGIQSYYLIGGGLDLTALNNELNTLQTLFNLN